MKAKCNQRWLGEAKTMSSLFLNEGGKFFWVQKTFPSLVFYNLLQGLLAQASSARPGELTCNLFFRGNITMDPYRLAFAYSNLLKLDQALIIYFKQTIVIITVNLKDIGLPCSDVFRLSSAGKGRRSVGRDHILYLHPSLST